MENPIEDSCEDPATGGAYRVPPRVMVRLSGIDAFRYLNGQVTRDLNRLGTAESLPACILTPKGKLCAPLLIRRDGQDLLLEADPALREALVARLERYIVADDVVVSVEEAPPLVHVFGRTLRAEMSASPEAMRIERLGVPGVDLPADSPLIEGLQLLDPEDVEMIRIGRGIPKWGAELTEETLPPEAGLDRTHIDYDRGCYPGQEVISRLKSLGRVNRVLHLLTAPPGISLSSGVALVNGEGKVIGRLTSVSTRRVRERSGALGYLPREIPDTLFALDPLTGGRSPLTISKTIGS